MVGYQLDDSKSWINMGVSPFPSTKKWLFRDVSGTRQVVFTQFLALLALPTLKVIFGQRKGVMMPTPGF